MWPLCESISFEARNEVYMRMEHDLAGMLTVVFIMRFTPSHPRDFSSAIATMRTVSITSLQSDEDISKIFEQFELFGMSSV